MSSLAIVPSGLDETIKRNMAKLVADAKAFDVTSAEDYKHGATLLQSLKEGEKDVAAYWKDPKTNAAKAHKEICSKEKAMLTPIKDAIGVVKSSMARYQMQEEAKRKAAEQEILRKQQQERERLIVEAMEQEKAGNQSAADQAMIMAEIVEDMQPAAAPTIAKVEGVSTRKIWAFRITDRDKVPVKVNGMELRPVDEKLLNKLATSTKGTMEIPGVEFYQKTTIATR